MTTLIVTPDYFIADNRTTYSFVDEGLDNIKQIGLTLRDKYSTTFDPNNAF